MTLPAPDISVEHTNTPTDAVTGKRTHGIGVTAKRDGKSRTWTGEGNSVNEAVKGVIEKIFSDQMSGEFHK